MDDTTQRRVELYVQSLAPCGTSAEQNEVVERLRDLERRDVVDHVDLTVWGDAVCLDGASATVGTGRHVAERVREFHSWCENGRDSLQPFFTWSTVESSLSGDSYRRVVLPHRCLAVYAGDQLEAVYPRQSEGAVQSLADGLRSLEGAADRNADPSLAFEEA